MVLLRQFLQRQTQTILIAPNAEDAPNLTDEKGRRIGYLPEHDSRSEYRGMVKDGVRHGIGQTGEERRNVYFLDRPIGELETIIKSLIVKLNTKLNKREHDAIRRQGEDLADLLTQFNDPLKDTPFKTNKDFIDFEKGYINYLEFCLNVYKKGRPTPSEHSTCGRIASQLAHLGSENYTVLNSYAGVVNDHGTAERYGVRDIGNEKNRPYASAFEGRFTDKGKPTNNGLYRISRDDILAIAHTMATNAGRTDLATTTTTTSGYSSPGRSSFKTAYNNLISALSTANSDGLVTTQSYDALATSFTAFIAACNREGEKGK